MKKSILALNLLWISIAAGTFYAGSVWREGQSAGSSGNQRNPSTAGSDKFGATSPNTKARPQANQAEAEVDEFVERYGLNSIKPLSKEMMGKAIIEALRETDPVKSQMLFARLMSSLTAENASAALAMIRENVGGFESRRYMGMLAYAWGGVDAKSAMEQLGERGDREGRFSQGTALAGWAGKDPQAAMAWLDAYKGEDKEGLTQSLIGGLAKTDIDAAMKYAGALENKDERSRAAQTLAREMIRTGGVDKATAWLTTLTDPSMKAGAFESVADQLRRSDPEQAAEFIRKNSGEEFARNTASQLAAEFSRKDMQKGLDFAASLTGKAQSDAYAQIINQWMDKDDGAEVDKASAYVNQMTKGPARDAAAAMISRQVSREDPAASIAWASSITDPAAREESLVSAARRYMRADPQAGAAWLAQSGLSPEAQQQVTAPREERGGPPGADGQPRGGPPGGGGFPGGGRRGGFGCGGNGGGGGRGR